MTADIHTVSVIADCLRNTAQDFTFLENRNAIFLVAVLEQLICSSQSGRTAADDDDILHFCFLFIFDF